MGFFDFFYSTKYLLLEYKEIGGKITIKFLREKGSSSQEFGVISPDGGLTWFWMPEYKKVGDFKYTLRDWRDEERAKKRMKE